MPLFETCQLPKYYIYIFTFLTLVFHAQKNNFNLALGFGPSYFFNDKTLKRYVDHTELIGFNYMINSKNGSIGFNPGLNLQVNEYHARLRNNGLVHVNQCVFNLNLDVLMKLNKGTLLRVGLSFNEVFKNAIFISQTDIRGRGYQYISNDEMDKNYFPANFQAGITAGLCFPFKIVKRIQKFDIKVLQFGSQLVNSDYNISKAIAGEDIKALSVKARPTMLILAIEFNLQRFKNKKTEDKEE